MSTTRDFGKVFFHSTGTFIRELRVLNILLLTSVSYVSSQQADFIKLIPGMERRVTERYIEAVARQRSLVVEHHGGEGGGVMSGHEGVVASTPAHPSSVPLLKEGSFGHHAASVHHTGAGQVRKSYCSVPFTQGALHSK